MRSHALPLTISNGVIIAVIGAVLLLISLDSSTFSLFRKKQMRIFGSIILFLGILVAAYVKFFGPSD